MFYVSVYYPISNRMCIVLCSPERNAKIRIRAQITQPIALSLSLSLFLSVFLSLFPSPILFSWSFLFILRLHFTLSRSSGRWPTENPFYRQFMCQGKDVFSSKVQPIESIILYRERCVLVWDVEKKEASQESVPHVLSSYCKVRDSMCLSVKSMGERVSNREDESWAVGSLRTQVEQVLCVLSSHTSQIEVIMTFVFLSRSE